MTNRWHVAHTAPCAEEKAAYHLRRQNFHVYLPYNRKRRRHARRTDWVNKALFPTYLFIEMDPEMTQWRCINSTVGIRRLVSQGERPAPVPCGVVEDIIAHEDDTGLVRMDRMIPFREGEAVQIATGAFSDRIGLFEDLSDDDRVTVLLDLLGRQVRVRVPLANVEAHT